MPPVVASLRMNLRVTRLTQRDQIAPIMCATFTQRKLMMNLFRRYDDPAFIAEFTERMLRSILIADPLPGTAISSLCVLIPSILLISTVDFLLMLRTVTSVCQVRTSGISARLLWFTWQFTHPQTSKKP